MYLKKVELESLSKSFLLFFVSQTLLVGALFFLEYNKEIKVLDDTLFNEMRVCSYDLKCDAFGIDFVPKEKFELYRLYKDSEGLSGYFSIGGSEKNALKIYYKNKKYVKKIAELQRSLVVDFLFVLLVIVLFSIVFSFYTLSPLRNALQMTEEFIKDILHDFNTPLSTLRLNLSMLKSQVGESKQIKRIENAVQNILNLQSNLRSYLTNHKHQKDEFDLKECIEDRVALIEKNFHSIKYHVDVSSQRVTLNRDSFTRVVDNILSNAGKYNRRDGEVHIFYGANRLTIQDTGKGIKNPKRVFERFYKEQERGIGIGLHIVKKLCDEMGIKISITSKVGVGSSFVLELSKRAEMGRS